MTHITPFRHSPVIANATCLLLSCWQNAVWVIDVNSFQQSVFAPVSKNPNTERKMKPVRTTWISVRYFEPVCISPSALCIRVPISLSLIFVSPDSAESAQVHRRQCGSRIRRIPGEEPDIDRPGTFVERMDFAGVHFISPLLMTYTRRRTRH